MDNETYPWQMETCLSLSNCCLWYLLLLPLIFAISCYHANKDQSYDKKQLKLKRCKKYSSKLIIILTDMGSIINILVYSDVPFLEQEVCTVLRMDPWWQG